MVQVLVVEDDTYERKRLVEILRESIEDGNIYEARTGKEAVRIFKNNHIDLFFLDIELPDFSGLKIAKEIRRILKYELTYIVFITAHVGLELEAFKKIHCYDFIEKPYKNKQIVEIVQKLVRGIVREEEKEENEQKEVEFELKSCTLKIKIDEIVFVESYKRNCIIYTKRKQYEISNYTMKRMLHILPRDAFMQTHKSYIIHLKHVRKIEKNGKKAWVICFDYEFSAYVSNQYKQDFMIRMNERKGNEGWDEMV